ncbi:hypothetical protein WMY93_012995 [Mugilogobius chulae]|uniref:C2H2-type domain-containing protein n=1 Tax=Mugilogobius chulae TaxID=88201 RepID=A0AAW0P282_9GOBI
MQVSQCGESEMSICSRPVSSSIDVPKRRQEVDMDELMAAMVLSSCPAVLCSTAPPSQSPQNSEHAAFRCLWPGCEKVLTSIVGIKRHVRTMHLNSCAGEYERCSRSEEDFYYTEVTSVSPRLLSALLILPQSLPLTCLQLTSPSSPSLSSSAPSSSDCFWQVQAEHSYQAPPPGLIVSAPSPACHWTTANSTHSKQPLHHRVRSVSVGEQWLQQNTPCRRVRGEAKKCRKVYGIEHREQWCTACRWKKACQRFLD